MSKIQFLNSEVKTAADAGITGNGTFDLYVSDKQSLVSSIVALTTTVCYEEVLPDPEAVAVGYRLLAYLETEDEDGNWTIFHAQYVSHVKPEQGRTHRLTFAPDYFTFDEGQPIDQADANGNIVVRESRKQGRLEDDFRLRIIVTEAKFGEPGAFVSAKITANANTQS